MSRVILKSLIVATAGACLSVVAIYGTFRQTARIGNTADHVGPAPMKCSLKERVFDVGLTTMAEHKHTFFLANNLGSVVRVSSGILDP